MSNYPDGPPRRLADSFIAIFINDEKELRSGWRALLFFVTFALAIMLLTGITETLARLIPSLRFLRGGALPDVPISERLQLLATLFAQTEILVAALIASAVCGRWLERRTLASVGYKLHRGWARDFGLGSLIGAAALALTVGLETAAGAAHFTVQTTAAGPLALGAGYLFVFFLFAGAFEELVFRGFIFQALTHNIGALPAVGITAVLFGAAHVDNTNFSAYAFINTVLAGVWLGVAYLKTRSLWLATALHYSWNFAMVFIFGLNVSGIPTFERLAWLHGESRPPLWISGGEYGPEAGVAATLALLISTLLIWKIGGLRATDEMLAAIRHGKPERPLSINPDEAWRAPEEQRPV